MGTQALWCVQQWAPNSVTVDSAVGIVEEVDYEGHPISARKRIPLGSDFQAELPKQLSASCKRADRSNCELDSLRWLGERVWPPQEACSMRFENTDSRANRQSPKCSCKFQGTLECVRLHIKEKRETLNAEVGEAFPLWGFDDMGEIVAEKWTHSDQSAFHDLVRRNPTSFWHDLLDYFPTKSMTDFVSYYFNVFVLRRRAIQNRISPTNIDSDDDEMVLESDGRECDSTSESNEDEGHDAVSEAEEMAGSKVWLGKEETLDGKFSQCVEFSGGKLADSAASNRERVASSATKDCLSTDCCGASNVEDRSQPWGLLTWENKSHDRSTREIGQSDKESWAFPSICSFQGELISTKGMMEEFFGSEVIDHSK